MDKELFESDLKSLFYEILTDRKNAYKDMFFKLKEASFNYEEKDFNEAVFKRYFRIIRKHEYETFDLLLKRKNIVSLTSYPSRIAYIIPTISSLRRQYMQADIIILWLAKSQFPNLEEDIPVDVLDELKKNDIKICWCNDIKAHKKYLYSMKEYPNDNIITADDDLIYDDDFISELYLSYLEFPEAISANRVHLMLFDKNNNPLQYSRWIKETRHCIYTPAMQLIATGGAGALYPPKLLKKEYLDEALINDLCPLADDLWLKTIEIISDVPVVLANDHYEMKINELSQFETLFSINGQKKKNDEQLNSIINWFKTNKDINIIDMLLNSNKGPYLNDSDTIIDFLFEERKQLKLTINNLKNELNKKL